MVILFKIPLFLLICSTLFDGSYSQLVTVNTSRGTVIGYHFDQGSDTNKTFYGQSDIFLGIPFALPPVGELRYKQPRPLIQYPGSNPYNATYYRKACIQPGRSLDSISEDCLYVNIYTPKVSTTKKYPVLLWIHGGGLTSGDGHLDIHSIVRNYVSKEVVVASIGYRLNFLGFFTTFTNDFPPNVGMLDQVLAIKFIKEEISYFGGDPNRITIFGESAGGHSVSSHTFSPLSQNLFQGVIMSSGTVLTCYEDSVGFTHPSYYMAKEACNYTDEQWNSRNFTTLKDCLMKISIEEGLTAVDRVFGFANNHVCWNMVQDNYFLPGNPQILSKKRPNIPAIIGTCKDEYAFWEMDRVKKDTNLTTYTKHDVEARISSMYASWFGNQSKNILQMFEDNYLKTGVADDDHLAWLQFAVDVGTPAYFTKGSLLNVQYYLENNNPNVYTYEFTLSTSLDNLKNPLPNWHPVPHMCVMPYLLSYGDWSETDKSLANFMQESWANFVKHGIPTLDGHWKPTVLAEYTNLEYLEFNNVSSMKTGYRSVDQIVWNQMLPKILGDSPPNLPDNYSVCTSGYQSKVKNTTCYEAFNTPSSWDVAQTACGTMSYGSLVTISSAFENSDLLGYAKKVYPSCSGFYIGLFKDSYVSNWNWANYDLAAYRNWKNGYPKTGSNASCVVLDAIDGSWRNQECDISLCYICSY